MPPDRSVALPALGAALVAIVLAVTIGACSGGGAAASMTAPPGTDATVTASGLRFAEATLRLPANRPAQVFFRNLDGEPHNVAIYRDASATANLFRGDQVTGTTAIYAIGALAPGQYFFRCDVHPSMTGTVVVGS